MIVFLFFYHSTGLSLDERTRKDQYDGVVVCTGGLVKLIVYLKKK